MSDSKRKKGFRHYVLKYYRYATLVLLILVFYFINHSFLGSFNIRSLLYDSAALLVMMGGMTFVLVLGSIDLSVGSVCSVGNVLLFTLAPVLGVWAYPAVLLCGALSGVLLGLIHTKLKVPSFIASLGFMSIWQSAAYLILEIPQSVPKDMQYLIAWGQVKIGVIALPFVLAVAVVILLHLLLKKTMFGIHVLAIGGNERMARVAGIPVDRRKIIAFAINGLCAALGGMLFMTKLKSTSPIVGDTMTLLVIASAALGGTSLSGGKGSVLGGLLGVLIIQVIKNGMSLVGVDAFWQNIVFGAVLVCAIALSIERKNMRSLAVK